MLTFLENVGLSFPAAALVCICMGAIGTFAGAGFTGASLLDESAGGYVLVGVVSFILAVVLTVICIKVKDKSGKEERKEKNRDNGNSADED